jgi:serine/threonine protein phosphatase PrpC
MFSLRRGDYVLVVCDGVSASRDSELASSAVAERVLESLAGVLGNAVTENWEEAMRGAISAGKAALAGYPARDANDNPPSTTVVAAVAAQGQVTVGWVGDSRAYWISEDGARQLTRDHSWMNSVVEAGEMSLEDAAKHPQAHAITRWLGADAGENSAPDTARFSIAPPGVLLLCTDGLWNYAAPPEAMAQLFRQSNGNSADALTVSRNLIQYAIAQGGQDNITAVVLQQSPDCPPSL